MVIAEKITGFITKNRILSHILFWVALYFLLIGRFEPLDENEDPLLYDMIAFAFYLSFSIIGAYFWSYRILPRIMKAKNYLVVFLEFMVGSYLLCVFARTMVVHVLEPIVRPRPFAQESLWEIMTDISMLFRNYFIHTVSLSLIFIFLKLIKDQYAANRHALELKKQKAEIELSSLKEQLNPHFLFNTLNNIYSLSLVNSPQTSPSIARLSGILDHLIYRCSSTYVRIDQEIELLTNYIGLEKLRYDDRLKVDFNHRIDKNSKIAPLILLSLLENAFKHGVAEDAGNAFIKIDLVLANNQFSYEIKNSFNTDTRVKEAPGIGLANIKKQLELLYPGQHVFTTHSDGTHFFTLLRITLTDE